MKKYLFATALVLSMFVGFSRQASASEGIVELENREGTRARCYALSVIMTELNYNVLVTCRDIIYPGGTDVFHYVVWANRPDSDDSFKLGTLGLGKVLFETERPFTGLFVTKEKSNKVNSPTGPVVMQGQVQSIPLFTNFQSSELDGTDLPELTPTPAPPPGGITNLFRVGGALAIIAIAGIILLVLFLTRP